MLRVGKRCKKAALAACSAVEREPHELVRESAERRVQQHELLHAQAGVTPAGPHVDEQGHSAPLRLGTRGLVAAVAQLHDLTGRRSCRLVCELPGRLAAQSGDAQCQGNQADDSLEHVGLRFQATN
jgi:hypothetical protein